MTNKRYGLPDKLSKAVLTKYCKSLRCQHEGFNNILAIIRHLYKLEVGTLPPPGQEVERAPAILTSYHTRTSL